MSICLTHLSQLVDVELMSVLTEITKLAIYYLSSGIPWLDGVWSNHKKYARYCVGYDIVFGSDASSYKIFQNNHRHLQVKGAVVDRHPNSISSMQVETNIK